ncbi:hypothetical protein K7I13_14230 [Brucepastera parasyntrophica]|uniref:hypothetical protein n=1 Tax=Brucepastera parasyntrophica TaxID=2880008 RepID=UPI00210D41C3|nr:hypothetical protein [Brucepastera parasyntrophica]ULQ59599.1 hypothetical protein K7I13_14230 [Brucepastera parasyntrophica]
MFEGKPLGRVMGVIEGGAGDLLEILLDGCDLSEPAEKKSGSNTRLIPLRNEFIGKISMADKTIELIHLWILE